LIPTNVKVVDSTPTYFKNIVRKLIFFLTHEKGEADEKDTYY